MKRTHLQDAKDRKDDEFYTRFEDIEKELGSYDWSNKIVGCPADTEESEFIRFFKTRAKKVIYWQEIYDEENKIIEQYSVRNYFVRVLLNYDPSKISFINL